MPEEAAGTTEIGPAKGHGTSVPPRIGVGLELKLTGTSTGESGSCFYELARTIDTAENTRILTGTLCGDEVDRTETWR